MAYAALTALMGEKKIITHREYAEDFARLVQRSGGCVPGHTIPRLVEMFDTVACLDGVKALLKERDDLREKLRISEDNRKLLAVEAFVKEGLVQATAQSDQPRCDHPVSEKN